MTLLWSVTGAVDRMEYFFGLWNEIPPRFKIVNDIAVHEHKGRIYDEYRDREQAERELALFRGMPKPIFSFSDPAFKLDYFDAGMPCASSRLRRALGDRAQTELVFRQL
ncbi:MAG: hypothetical protein JOY90_21970 [Bradyrhizobium sp.]|nr:hypothetical protein [Bradyrhizobium sp.]